MSCSSDRPAPVANDVAGNPLAAVRNAEGNLAATFEASKNLSGTTYSIQQSPDLVFWSGTGAAGVVNSGRNGYVMQAAIPVNGRARIFLCLPVTAP